MPTTPPATPPRIRCTSAHLLEQSGFALDGHGTWTAHGKPVSLDIVWAVDDPGPPRSGRSWPRNSWRRASMWSATPMSSVQLDSSVLPTGAFDLALVPVDASAYPSALGNVFSTSPAITGGASSEDWSGFDDPKIDALFTQAVQELAPPRAHGIYQQIDQALWTAMPTLPLFAEPTSARVVVVVVGGHRRSRRARAAVGRAGVGPSNRGSDGGLQGHPDGDQRATGLALECSMR